ncbi:uncharacterized protein LOC128293252 [Gossypium arboreum]|uniref:uncharacterized protein LOC128293252 n=1 Tax=Gossypium arboreum TaxID=29729 RepID=UPI0022F1B804|nr:uncharacterized protein LOC128293252 [Gossypium arboreum]
MLSSFSIAECEKKKTCLEALNIRHLWKLNSDWQKWNSDLDRGENQSGRLFVSFRLPLSESFSELLELEVVGDVITLSGYHFAKKENEASASKGKKKIVEE